MNGSHSTQSAIKRPRIEPVRNYLDVLVDKRTQGSNDHHKNIDKSASGEAYNEAMQTDALEDASIGQPTATEYAAANGDEAESLPFDSAIMSWYNVSGEQAQYLMSFLHAQFCYANPYIRTGLFGMVLQMKHRMLETISLHDKTSEQEHEIAQLKLKNQELEELKEHEIAQLKIKNRELEELNETLEFENLRIPQLQNQVDATQTHFANYVEETREMQANASRVDELESINTVLKINLADSKQRRLQLETELKSTKAKIHSSLDLFKENVTPFSFPVMQNNGHMVDFHRIISKWAKTAEEDDNTASRSFMCSIENKHTSLVQPRIIDQIQRIAIELGLRAEPPLLFELKTGDAWVQLSNKHHIQLIATVCYLYANRKAVQTADTVVNKERLSFVISTPNHTQSVLRCHQAHAPVRIRINRTGWNPFPNMIFAMEDH